MKKITFLLAIITPIIYVTAVVLGGILWPGYSHISQPISELTMASSPVLKQVGWIFTLYGLLLLAFGFGFLWISRKEKNSLLEISAAALILCSLAGLIMVYAPQDPIGTPLTTKGLIHLILAGTASLSTILAIFSAGFGFGRAGERGLKRLSLFLGAFVLITGPITTIAPTKFPQYFGLLERLTIGGFILWLLLIGITLAQKTNKEKCG